MHRLFALLAILACLLAHPARASEPIEPEKAFAMQARALDAQTVEVVFEIAKDYYLYGSKFRFSAQPAGVTLGEVQRPPGKLKHDEFFGEVETYRGTLRMLVPVAAPAGVDAIELTVSSQGCWDGGVCYPPLPQQARVALVAASPAAGASLLDGALARGDVLASDAVAPPAAVSLDESGRIAGLLRDASVPLVLASFFGFGLLLAFTPCHFPMIPILSGIIVGGGGQHLSRTRTFALSLAYVLGMAVTYALAGVGAGLSGTLLVAALQNVWVLSAFALVFVALALSMFGFYELQLPSALQSRIADTASHNKGGHLGGVAAMGALSALIVGPCLAAPLAGALLYIARSGDAALGGGALFAMGLGLGAPLLAVGMATRSVLPKVGPWMDGVKKAFGVILLGVAIWLLMPVLPPLAGMLAWAALLLFSGIFLHALDPLPPHAHGWQRFWKGVGVVLAIGGAAMLVGALAGSRDPLQPLAVLRAEASPAAETVRFERVGSLAELESRLAAAERPVMLDFYADWCVSCKEMERYTFPDPQVAQRLAQMTLLKADVTANSEEHKALLKRFGLFGPPGIIFFDGAGRERTDLRVVGFQKPEAFAGVLDSALRR
ncbi:protein-disulfide reductase DsbD [Azoarcus olearius]|uniref:protein-disulfide reductase DsbD n=1 Tax=Azoarcus sp. (strain BH72) TaxID=418699 RepID=UPI0005A013FD|nr:protein-disulfide reductase DsbD [Azoarcus olearius]